LEQQADCPVSMVLMASVPLLQVVQQALPLVVSAALTYLMAQSCSAQYSSVPPCQQCQPLPGYFHFAAQALVLVYPLLPAH